MKGISSRLSRKYLNTCPKGRWVDKLTTNLAYDLNQDSAEQLVQDMEASDLDNLVESEVTSTDL